MNFDKKKLEWTREPESYTIVDNRIEITTKPFTDLWQRTYYHFRNDNALVLQMHTSLSVSISSEWDIIVICFYK